MTIAHQPLDVEIFYPYQSTAPSNRRRKLVQQIMVRTGNAVMHPGQLAFRLLLVLATLGASRQLPVQSTNLLQQMAHRPLVFKSSPIGKRGQPIEPDIDADRWLDVLQHHIGWDVRFLQNPDLPAKRNDGG